ncbi:MAG: NAD(P)-dependent oxidoreductase [Faecalibacillus faecis]
MIVILPLLKKSPKELPYVDEVATINDLDTILPQSDFVILSLPQSKETIHLFNKDKLLKMKKDAVLINVGRGSAINEDLIEVLNQGVSLWCWFRCCGRRTFTCKAPPLWSYDWIFTTS